MHSEYRNGYRHDITMQIAVRLPDEMVEFLDRPVADHQHRARPVD